MLFSLVNVCEIDCCLRGLGVNWLVGFVLRAVVATYSVLILLCWLVQLIFAGLGYDIVCI